jgi:putative DNA primase/helicase
MSAELEEQLAIIAGDEPETSYFEIRFGRGGAANQKRYAGIAEVERAVKEIQHHTDGNDVYIGAAPRVKKSGQGRDVARVWSLRADCDSQESVELLLKYEPAPTLVLESSPGRALGLWALTESLSPEEAKAHIKVLAAELGSDPVIYDAPRIIRAAGSSNHKHGEPTPVTRLAGSGERYAIDLFASSGANGNGMPSKLSGGSEPASMLSHLLANRPDEGGRNNWLARVAGHYAVQLPWKDAYEETVRGLGRELGLEAAEIEKLITSIWEAEQAKQAKLAAAPEYHLTDDGNAQRLADIAAGKLLYHFGIGWLRYDGKVWRRDQAKRVYQEARGIVKLMRREAPTLGPDDGIDLAKHAYKTEKRGGLDAMVVLAQTIEALILDDLEQLDPDPFALNTPNGIVDLRSGKIRDHDSLAYCSQITRASYDPDAKCPEWERLLEVWQPDEKLRWWLQRLTGYSVHGFHSELFPILHGFGANGKSSFVDGIVAVLGSYAWTGSRGLLIAKQEDTPGSESAIAQLFGKRLVVVRETRAGKALDETFVKEATGDLKLEGKYMRQDRFEFVNKAAILLATNHLPKITGGDHGIWRRTRAVPWGVEIPKAEQMTAHEMAALLKAEWPGILRWIVDGAVGYNRDGLDPEPEAVHAATLRYRSDEDLIGTWFEEHCERVPVTQMVPRAVVRASFVSFCEAAGRKTIAEPQFVKAIENRGVLRDKQRVNDKTTNVWLGLAMRAKTAC